ncbi:hypothetical protein G1H11_00205 [Phytoactinopolyspora alkaliphila]|uniref:alpha-amylase n=1 Tax=Phytoactinopolyspora alkaliphila TaxID=1783498 RepID=A0A6N9YFI1_9ACTN|nr:carboxypeptidase regulatory-like domain-containing protein [Phytoactinopolyspora alkaliphila]NED93734.1 hypothetical protein [Phytoactinopolyspora alkaliphila]
MTTHAEGPSREAIQHGGLKISGSVDRLDLEPGQSAELSLKVTNSTDVIDGISARVLGLPDGCVTSRPAQLSLFPEASGTITVEISVPPTHPSGTHPATVEVSSVHREGMVDRFQLHLVVATRPGVDLTSRPQLVRSRRRASFAVTVSNTGNSNLDLTCAAVDAERSLRLAFSPPTLSLPPGSEAITTVTARAPRRWFGGDHDHGITIRAIDDDASGSVALTYRQRPMIGRGAVTALVLAGIVALWATAFLLGIAYVLGDEPVVKTAPASFFAASATADPVAAGVTREANTSEPANEPARATDTTPPGALPKDGLLPPGVGGTLTGTVTGADSGEHVGQVEVEALRRTPDGLAEVSSAATQADGRYTLAGLFPGEYLLRFGGPGHETVWYPSAPDDAAAEPVIAHGRRSTEGIDVVISGEPASISGTVDVGDVTEPVPATVTARPAWAEPGDAPDEFVTTTDESGSYTLDGLAAPGTYELTLEAEGYRPTTVVEHVRGGQQRFVSSVRLATGSGQISGRVSDGEGPLGGVTVSTAVDDTLVAAGTPTVGDVGTFVLPGLPTPGTYVVTFTLEDYASQSAVVELGAGENVTDLSISMAGGAGTIAGMVTGEDGAGIGGADVSVGGLAEPVSTITVTDGSVGSFAIAGLDAGSYTLTFTRDGYQEQTVPVTVTGDAPVPPVNVVMPAASGEIAGRVTDSEGEQLAGIEVSATDGREVWSTTSTAGGRYRISELPAGTYTVSVTLDGRLRSGRIVAVTSSDDAGADLRLDEAR